MPRIEGVNVAAITPRRKDRAEIDLAAALEVIDFLGASGAAGIALLGSTGEFLHFDTEDRQHLISFAVKRSRVPVLAGVAHSTLDGALAFGRHAAAAGAAGLLVMPPYFFRYPQESVKEFFLRFIDELDDAVPVFLYNIPFFTSEITCETAVELLSTGLFAGIKNSSRRLEDFERFKVLRQQVPFTLLIGNDVIFTSARSAGADGVVSGVACAVPELMVGLDRAIRGGDISRRDRLEARLQEFIAWIDSFPVPVGIKEAVRLRGLQVGPHATPLGPRLREKLAEFAGWFPGWLDQVRKEARDA